MVNLQDLLGKGFFPRELPPTFTTESYAQAIINNLSSLPNSFASSFNLISIVVPLSTCCLIRLTFVD